MSLCLAGTEQVLKMGLDDDDGSGGGLVRTMVPKAPLPWACDPMTMQKKQGPQDFQEC